MFATTSVTVFLYLSAAIFKCGSSVKVSSANVSLSCPYYQTECPTGCCPFQEGVCCLDGMFCCQHGQTCIPFIGMCIGPVKDEKNGDISLISNKSTPLINSVTKCPAHTTECGPDRCCPLEGATCCSDHIHCCPHGMRCDVPHKRCLSEMPDSDREENDIRRDSRRLFYSVEGAFQKPLSKTIKKSPYKKCPFGGRLCPSYMNCCLNNNEEWGCCPDLSILEVRYGSGECCDTLFGHMCCPDDFPTCTIFGCTKQ